MFFDDARTDADLVVGEPGDGWRVAMGTLTFERGVSTLGQQIRYARELSNLVELAERNGRRRRPADPRAADAVVGGPADDAVLRAGHHGRRERGPRPAGPGQRVEAVVGQLASRSRRAGDGHRRARPACAGQDGEFDEWQQLYLFTRADTIYGGSNEIQRNIIAERVLGLPREVKG